MEQRVRECFRKGHAACCAYFADEQALQFRGCTVQIELTPCVRKPKQSTAGFELECLQQAGTWRVNLLAQVFGVHITFLCHPSSTNVAAC